MIKKYLKKRICKILYNLFNSNEFLSLNPNYDKNFKYLGKLSTIPNDAIILNAKYISIGKNFGAMRNLRIEAWDYYEGVNYEPKIYIGDNVCMNTDIHIGAINNISIGNNVLFASRIFITDHFHGKILAEELSSAPQKRKLFSKGSVTIEDNVWIGEGVSILPDVTIGKNSIIGANAVVTNSFPKNSIIAGVPAKLIKTL